MNEQHRKLYEYLGYLPPGPGVDRREEDSAQAELPLLELDDIADLERALDSNPEETLARARLMIDENISETELRATIGRARLALNSPDTAIALMEAEAAHQDAANPLPPGFNFEGLDLDEINIKPGDSKFEAVADALGWVLFGGLGLLTQVFKADFRWHGDSASRFAYSLDEPGDGRPLDVALFSDFGTGRYYSRYIAKQLRTRKFPYAIHLGDVYYAGRSKEYQDHFSALLDPILTDTKFFTLNSNHEMCSGAKPYFKFMDKRRAWRPEKQKQEGSYFSLSSSRFQIVGIDTAYFGHGRYKEEELIDWLAETLGAGRAAGRLNILLSGDQPYSYGHEGHSDLLAKDMAELAVSKKLVDLWFWGNTHYCALFDADAGSPFIGSCIGHAGYPYDTQSPGKPSPAPLLFLETEARFPSWTGLRQDRGNNGYCIMSLRADGSIGLRYVDWMARTRCEAELSRTADNRLRVASTVLPAA
jgi:hypothetical protein